MYGFYCVDTRGGFQELASSLLKPHVEDEIGVGGDGVLNVALPVVPPQPIRPGSRTRRGRRPVGS